MTESSRAPVARVGQDHAVFGRSAHSNHASPPMLSGWLAELPVIPGLKLRLALHRSVYNDISHVTTSSSSLNRAREELC